MPVKKAVADIKPKQCICVRALKSSPNSQIVVIIEVKKAKKG
jgi:hypothetical protein